MGRILRRFGKTAYAIVIFFAAVSVAFGGVRTEIEIPDIPGYLTLKCDLHLHTVYSDGAVWPTVRVDEAWTDGLDAIALTDHIEYLPHAEYGLSGRNRPFEIAKGRAAEAGIILINGGEITRSWPLGHSNAIFVPDVEMLNIEDARKSYEKAAELGAFVFWNHPGWRMPNEIPVWDEVQEDFYQSGLFQGIEIVNGETYYPLAFTWALDKNLTILGNSDAHNPVALDYEKNTVRHRPVTLVFAKERSEAGIHAALRERSTAVYHENTIMGKAEFLKPLATAILEVENPEIIIGERKYAVIKLTNHSCLDIELERGADECPLNLPMQVVIPHRSTAVFSVSGKLNDLVGQTLELPFTLTNFLVSPEQKLAIGLSIKLVPKTGN